MERIYLDHLSTTPVDPRVVEALLPYLTDRFGHPGSRGHPYGWEAEKAVETARARVADLIGADPAEIVFTSGGAEADNLAVKGLAEQRSTKGRHLVTSQIENRPVLDAMAWLERRGFRITRVAPDGTGRIDPNAIEAALEDETILVSIQAANHEVGTRQPIADIGRICAEHEVVFHTDATAALAWDAIDVKASGIHLLSISGHRFYGPKGIGALYVKRRKPRIRLVAQIHGGGHERGLRSGTLNVAGAVAMGVAAELVRTERDADTERVGALRDRLERVLLERIPDTQVLGNPAHRLPNVTNLVFPYVEAEALVTALPNVALATGSACSSALPEPSHVLRAMGLSKTLVAGAIRMSLGRTTTTDEVTRAGERIAEQALAIQALNPAFQLARRAPGPGTD